VLLEGGGAGYVDDDVVVERVVDACVNLCCVCGCGGYLSEEWERLSLVCCGFGGRKKLGGNA
jgi:hypothetical protein